MTTEKELMEPSKVLPEGFDGTFRFTNWTDSDFIGRWGKKEYRFPAQTTSPILMSDQTPLEIQQIRKKFARDLADQEFFRSGKYEKLRSREGARDDLGMIQPRGNGMSHAGSYSLDDLAEMIQRCLEPLPAGTVSVAVTAAEPIEEMLTRNEEGELNSMAVRQSTDLVEERKKLKRKALGE